MALWVHGIRKATSRVVNSASDLYYKSFTIVNDNASVISKWLSKFQHHLRSYLMTLAKARTKASAKAKHIYNTGVNYDRHLQLSQYFYSTGHRFSPVSWSVSTTCSKYFILNFILGCGHWQAIGSQAGRHDGQGRRGHRWKGVQPLLIKFHFNLIHFWIIFCWKFFCLTLRSHLVQPQARKTSQAGRYKVHLHVR